VASSRFPLLFRSFGRLTHTHTPAAYTKQKNFEPETHNRNFSHVVDENNKNMGPSLVFNFLLFYFLLLEKKKKKIKHKKEWASLV
jgi:hypothetical protein